MKNFKQESYVVINTSLAAPWKAGNQETRGNALTQPRPKQLRTGGNTGAGGASRRGPNPPPQHVISTTDQIMFIPCGERENVCHPLVADPPNRRIPIVIYVYTASPLHTNEFRSKIAFVSPTKLA